MPLIRGTTLAERIGLGPVSQDEVVRIGAALGGALAYIHAHGVVHRDVKPSNVLLGHNGQIFLADFGIARSGESDQTLTAPGQLTGTAAYLAPEQVEGDMIGSGCDVYALGLVLLEALTAVRAYRGSTLEQALARLWRQPEIPLSLGPGWVRLLDAMTARDPDHRPASASITELFHRHRPEGIDHAGIRRRDHLRHRVPDQRHLHLHRRGLRPDEPAAGRPGLPRTALG
jgi:serine/threonine protein kinase